MRVLLLLLLISAAIYVYTMVMEERIEISSGSTPVPTRSASSYAAEAESLYLQGQLDEAILVYGQAIALDLGDVLLVIPVVRLLTLEKRTAEAIQLGEQVTEMAPENARAWAVLGMAYDWNGDVAEAVDACKRSITLDPTYAEGYAYLAEAYVDAGRWADAMDAAETALQLDPYSVDVQRNYGYVLEKQGDYVGALAAYERALELHPNLIYIHIAVGLNYRALGDLSAAVQSFERAIAIDPDQAEAYDQLGWTYYVMQEYQQAEVYFQKAIDVNPEFGQAFGHLAINYWTRRNYEDAIPNFERVIELECMAARQRASLFYVTIENQGGEIVGPSPDLVMRGDFTAVSSSGSGDPDVLRATLAARDEEDEDWAGARGAVTLNVRTGEYMLTLEGLPRLLRRGQVYVGWFEGVNSLSGTPLSTGPLDLGSTGGLQAQFETGWVEGPRIDYFYTLGLAHFYMGACDRSYPLFEAALQIDPEEINALDGIRLCQEAEMEEE